MGTLIQPLGYELFNYQKDSVVKLMSILEKHGGAMLCDETGLGKTLTAISTVINLGCKNILVLSPVANQKSWKRDIESAKAVHSFNAHVCTHSKIADVKDIDYILVDEAHNYRNFKSAMFKNLWHTILKNKGVRVILITATPVQNDYEQLQNLLSLLPLHKDSPLTLLSRHFFSIIYRLESSIDKLRKDLSKPSIYKDSKRHETCTSKIDADQNLVVKYTEAISQLCSFIRVRNTRESIKNKYPNDVAMMGAFPKRVDASIRLSDSELFLENTLNSILQLRFYYHNPLFFSQEAPATEKNTLTGILRTFLLKRFDSSFTCLHSSIEEMMEKTNSRIAECEEYLQNKNAFMYTSNLSGITYEVDTKAYCEALKNEYKTFQSIYHLSRMASMYDDVKMDAIINTIKSAINTGGKVVVFSEYYDTLSLLSNKMKNTSIKFLDYTNSSSPKLLDTIAENFDANHDNLKKDYNVLLCTDRLAEGVNLHAADHLIHCDEKWNPSKTAQRNGRIDRIEKNALENKVKYTYSVRTTDSIEQQLQLQMTIKEKTTIADVFFSNENPLTIVPLDCFKYLENQCVDDRNNKMRWHNVSLYDNYYYFKVGNVSPEEQNTFARNTAFIYTNEGYIMYHDVAGKNQLASLVGKVPHAFLCDKTLNKQVVDTLLANKDHTTPFTGSVLKTIQLDIAYASPIMVSMVRDLYSYVTYYTTPRMDTPLINRELNRLTTPNHPKLKLVWDAIPLSLYTRGLDYKSQSVIYDYRKNGVAPEPYNHVDYDAIIEFLELVYDKSSFNASGNILLQRSLYENRFTDGHKDCPNPSVNFKVIIPMFN